MHFFLECMLKIVFITKFKTRKMLDPLDIFRALESWDIIEILGASEITANLYCICVYLYWEGCVICSKYLH